MMLSVFIGIWDICVQDSPRWYMSKCAVARNRHLHVQGNIISIDALSARFVPLENPYCRRYHYRYYLCKDSMTRRINEREREKKEKERKREEGGPRTLDRAVRKVCPNDKRISAVIKGMCQISLHSRGSSGLPFIDERGRKGVEQGWEAERGQERKFHVRIENLKAWDFTCIDASLLAKKKRGEKGRRGGFCHRPGWRPTSLGGRPINSPVLGI